MPDVSTLALGLQRGAEIIGSGLGPDGNWEPCLSFTDRDGQVQLALAKGLASDDDTVKAEAMRNTLAVLLEHGATNVAFIHEVWVVHADADETQAILEGRTLRPNEGHPDRVEQLFVVMVESDASVQVRHADVTRSPGKHPILGPWVESGIGYDGLFIDLLKGVVCPTIA